MCSFWHKTNVTKILTPYVQFHSTKISFGDMRDRPLTAEGGMAPLPLSLEPSLGWSIITIINSNP